MSTIKVSILEDHNIVLEGLMMLLEKTPDVEVVGGYADPELFLEKFPSLEIDVAIIDIYLGERNGLDICKIIKEKKPTTAVIILSNITEGSVVLKALQNGADGYLIKNTSSEKLIEAIQSVHNGSMYFSSEITEILAKASIAQVSELPSLTRRELEILKLLAEGSTTAIIAASLFISPFTVETHRRNLMQKFKVKNVAELIMVAAQNNMI